MKNTIRSQVSSFAAVGLLLLCTLASLWGILVWKTVQERQVVLARNGDEARNLVHSLAQHASKTFGSVKIALLGAKEYIRRDMNGGHATDAINRLLADYTAIVPQLREIGVLNKSGEWIYSSTRKIPTINNFDREYFQYHKYNLDESVRISDPLVSRTSGRPTVLVTERLSNDDGTFEGVIFAAIDLQYFRSFYQSFAIGLNGGVTMLKSDGKVIVHKADADAGRDLSTSALFTKHLREAETGLYQITSPFDGLIKQIAYERLLDFPIVISVAMPEAEILEEWRKGRNFDLLIAAGLSCLLSVLAFVLAAQIRRRQLAESLLSEQEAGYRLLAENADDVVTRVDMDGIRRYVSPSIEKLTGRTAKEVVGRSALEFTHPDHKEGLQDILRGLSKESPSATYEYLIIRKDGSLLWVETKFNLVTGPDGSPAEVIAIIRDISKRKATEELLLAASDRLKTLSETDGLTGIANRRRFDDTFDRERRRAQRAKSTLSVLFIDIDMFKAFNDTYGHPEGDVCLQKVAQSLLQNLRRSSDLVARYGGEEFAVILPETTEAEALVVGENLRKAVERLCIPHKKTPKGSVSISVGVAGSTLDLQDDGTGLLPEADAALYRAKNAGRDRVCGAINQRFRPRLVN